MKQWFSLLFCSFVLAGCASDTGRSAAPADPARNGITTQMEGKYAGKWTSSDGAIGTMRITLKKPSADSPWEGKVTFTYQDDEAATTIKSVEVKGGHLVLTYDYDIQGNKGGVEATGDLAGDTLQGSYKITTGDGEPGTWTASRAP